LAAGCVVLVAAFSLFARGVIGGGDAKLAAATALWLGFDHLLPYLLYASLIGGGVGGGLGLFPLGPPPALAGGPECAAPPARQGRRRALLHCPCRRGACRLPGHPMDGDRSVIARVPSAAILHRSTDC